MQTSDLPVARQSENEKKADEIHPIDFVNLTTNPIENQEDSIVFFDPIKAVDRQEFAESDLVISRMKFFEIYFEAGFSGIYDVFSSAKTPRVRPCWSFQGIGLLAESVSRSRDVATSGVVRRFLIAAEPSTEYNGGN